MKIASNLTDHEKNLLFLLFTLLILFCAYQFGYVPFTERAENLHNENLLLTSRVNELQIKKNQEEKFITETKDYEEKINEMLGEIPVRITQEKSIMLITELEDYADIKISSINFQDISKFYSGSFQGSNMQSSANVSTNESEQDSDVAENNTANNESTMDVTKEAATNDSSRDSTNLLINTAVTGYSTAIVLTYQTSYEGLKKCIEFINENEEKMNITDISAAFDNTTGNLTGTLTINLYALDGIDKQDEEVKVPGIHIGVDNIFDSIENSILD